MEDVNLWKTYRNEIIFATISILILIDKQKTITG